MSSNIADISSRRVKWSEALLNGGYKQATGILHAVETLDSDSGFCCLGVACDLFKDELNIKTRVSGHCEEFYDDVIGDINSFTAWRSGYMPIKVARFLGLNQNSQQILAALNDKRVSFAIIASIVHLLPIDLEENYED